MILFDSPIFGPVHSRRLGVSLGINLLPSDGKLCSFDCLYCECGFNAEHRTRKKLPTKEEVAEALEKKLSTMREEGVVPDVITFAGNGEPTLHPHFAEIIDSTIILRDKYCPGAKVSVLSNSTRIHKSAVHAALMKVDNNILKLDTIDENYIHLLDRPNASFDLAKTIAELKRFEGHVIIQTIFLKGLYHGKNIDNTKDEYVLPWLDAVRSIAPSEVMIYTIDRETPEKGLQKAAPEELDRIVELLHGAGLKASASY